MLQRALFYNSDAQILRLQLFSGLLAKIFQESIVRQEKTVQLTVLYASLLKINQSANAVMAMAKSNCVEEIQAIARTMVEVTVNAAYIQHASEKELERYLEFHPEAMYKYPENWRPPARSRSREWMAKLGGMVGRSAPARKDEASPNWSEKTLIERASSSDNLSNIPLMTLLVRRCYPQSHAAVHGTVGSLGFFISALDQGAPDAEARKAQLNEALFAANLSLLTFCLYINSHLRLWFDDAIDEVATANMDTLSLAPGGRTLES